MPSRQTLYNRQQDVARLTEILGACVSGWTVQYDRSSYVVVDATGTERVCGRYQVVWAWLDGFATGRRP